jgi:hypothetical protein
VTDILKHLLDCLPLGDEYTAEGEWPDVAAAEALCGDAGLEIVFSPDLGDLLFVELHRDGENVAQALIPLSALESMPADVRDWALAEMINGLRRCAEDRRKTRTVSDQGGTDIDTRGGP